MKFKTLLASVFLLSIALYSQTPKCTFQRGFNLTGWFQVESAVQIGNYVTKTDFENLANLGCDHIRLPIDLFSMSGSAPDYKLDPILLKFLDRPVNWAEELEMYIILDHHSDVPDITINSSVRAQLIAVWQQIAEHFKDRSTLVYYEIKNEPQTNDNATWNIMQEETIKAIRAIDTKHTIIVTPADWGSYRSLHLMPEFDDDNLIYTFHFYDPFLFTHQGASWTTPSMISVANIPYPYDESRMPSMPPELTGTWIGNFYDTYQNDGTQAFIRSQAEIAVQFRNERNVPIHCGEFGAFQIGSTTEDRARWTTDVRTFFEDNGIAWTMWSYHGGFGIFKPGSAEIFSSDLDTPMLEALGLNQPPYQPVEIIPDTTGLVLYDDFVNEQVHESSWSSSGIIDYYSTVNPVQGDYCIQWINPGQYETLGWQFSPTKDFSFLLNEGYRIRFWLKVNAPNLRFDVRFIDTDLGDGYDHPWRMTKTIDNSIARLDGTWEQIDIPFKDMAETGSWHNDTWYTPAGDFDWSRIDIFQFVAEHSAIQGIPIYLDDIKIIKVLNPSLTLLSPNGGEQWLTGSEQTIKWKSQDIKNVKLEYSQDNGSSWKAIMATIPALNSSYNWHVPNVSSTSCIIKISNAADPNMYDVSDNTFIIINPSITVISPNGGEQWQEGSMQTISWSYQDINNIKIEYSINNGIDWQTILSIKSVANSYVWNIPSTESDKCFVKMTSEDDSSIADQSDGVFSIVGPSSVDKGISVPDEYKVFENYPNPFNASTSIKFGLAEACDVKINIFNSRGQQVYKLLDSYLQAGYHVIPFHSGIGKNKLSSGVYYYKIETINFKSVKKMILLE